MWRVGVTSSQMSLPVRQENWHLSVPLRYFSQDKQVSPPGTAGVGKDNKAATEATTPTQHTAEQAQALHSAAEQHQAHSGFASKIYAAADVKSTYGEIERNVLKRIGDENRTRFRAVLITSIMGIIWTTAIFGDDIRKLLTNQTATLATETLENESLKVQTQELASAVVTTVLNDADVTSKAAQFLKMASTTEETQQALLQLTMHVLQHPDTLEEVTKLGKELVARLAADRDTVDQLALLVADALATPELKEAAQHLVVWLCRNPEVLAAVSQLSVDVMATPEVSAATNGLMAAASSKTMEDEDIMDQSREFLADVVGDDRLQREGGHALWNTVTHAIQPSVFRVVGFSLTCASALVLQCIFSPF